MEMFYKELYAMSSQIVKAVRPISTRSYSIVFFCRLTEKC